MVLEISTSEENQDEEYDDTDDDDDDTAPTTSETKDEATDSTPSKRNKQSSTDTEPMNGVCKIICKACKIMTKVYNHIVESEYRKRVVLGTVIFILALKLSDECYGLVFPVRDYVPFED